jgi:hypothetical protein
MIRTFVKPNAAIVLVATLLCIVQYAFAQAPLRSIFRRWRPYSTVLFTIPSTYL